MLSWVGSGVYSYEASQNWACPDNSCGWDDHVWGYIEGGYFTSTCPGCGYDIEMEVDDVR